MPHRTCLCTLWILMSFVIPENVFAQGRQTPTYLISAPETFRLGIEETVSISVFNVPNPVRVIIFLQSYPDRTKTFSFVDTDVRSAIPTLVKVKVTEEHIVNSFSEPQYVFFIARSTSPALRFHKEALILLKPHSGYVFLQTDKPVYTPNQDVRIRAITVDKDTYIAKTPLELDIINPEGIIVERHKKLQPEKGILSKTFHFPSIPVFGNWKVVVRSGSAEAYKNTSIEFEVKEYVLPTFSVTIKGPQYILPGTDKVRGHVIARYVYGKPVKGIVHLKFGVKEDNGDVTVLYKQRKQLDEHGQTEFRFKPRQVLQNVDSSLWFPEIEGRRLYIHAMVTEQFTGHKAMAVDSSVKFVKSPYVMKLDKLFKYFKPGLLYDAKLEVEYANGSPAAGLTVKVSAKAQRRRGAVTTLSGDTDSHLEDVVTGRDGQANFLLDVPPDTTYITITARTANSRLQNESQAEASVVIYPYESPSRQYIHLRPSQSQIKVGQSLNVEVQITAENIFPHINYMLIGRGEVLMQGSTVWEAGMVLHIYVTHKMVPSVRLVAYYLNEQSGSTAQVIADSVWLDIDDECEKQLTIKPDKQVYQPGDTGRVRVKAAIGSQVALLAVDQAVYWISQKNVLTASKMWSAIESTDLGCGPGSGKNNLGVFQDAGLAVISNTDMGVRGIKRNVIGCKKSRSKRSLRRRGRMRSRQPEVRRPPEDGSGLTAEQCCDLGRRPDYRLTCRQRAVRLRRQLGYSRECRKQFYKCCKQGQGETPAGPDGIKVESPEPDRGRIGDLPALPLQESYTFEDIEENESKVDVRSDFPEAWMFKTVDVGISGQTTLNVTYPDTITTWVLQGVSVAQLAGMCVASPHNVTTSSDFFIKLHLPYSVIKGEQVEIEATVFNYRDETLPVRMYIKGVEGLCTGAQIGQNSERKQFEIPPNDAVTVTFPVVPLKIGEITVTVLAFTPVKGDVVRKKLLVQSDGIEEVKTYSMILDPARSMRSQRGSRIRGQNSEQLQIDLRLPKEAIPGSEKCIVSIKGDIMGPTVNVELEGVHKVMRLPTGCGEQTIIKLAPTVYAASYLHHAGKMTPELRKRAEKFISQGYQRELVFRKPDGSFSIWMTDYPSSTWLTAFVLKILCQAKKMVFIDSKVLCGGIRWLSTQQHHNGHFKENYRVHHKSMKGGVHGHASLTAYVLISMLECQCQNTDNTRSVRKAVAYLERHISHLRRPYARAIVAYALALARSPKARQANERLKQSAKYSRESNARYWPVDHKAFAGRRTPYWYRKRPSAISIETTSYALLTQLLHNDIEYSQPIVSWLISQRNSKGAFISTQDTVVALQALTEYSIKVKQQQLNMRCRLQSDGRNKFKKEIVLSELNSRVQHQVEVPVGQMLNVHTVGTGVGQIQVEARYHVPTKNKHCHYHLRVQTSRPTIMPKKNILEDLEEDNDDWGEYDYEIEEPRMARLRVNRNVQGSSRGRSRTRNSYQPYSPQRSQTRTGGRVKPNRRSRFGNRGKSSSTSGHASTTLLKTEGEPAAFRSGASSFIITITVCTSYKKPAGSEMTILHIGLFTGFEPFKSHLEKIKKDKRNEVKQYEVVDRAVIFYLDKVHNKTEQCLQFDAKQTYVIGNVRPVAVKVYDYYEPDDACVEFYHPRDHSPLLKKVCSRSQCLCAEGNCAQCHGLISLDEYAEVPPLSYAEMKRKACNKADYVFKVKIKSVKFENGFENYIGHIQKVLKKGQEDTRPGHEMLLLKTCACPNLFEERTYLIMGRDGLAYTNKHGKTRYKYLLDNYSYVIQWLDVGPGLKADEFQYARDLNNLSDVLPNCQS